MRLVEDFWNDIEKKVMDKVTGQERDDYFFQEGIGKGGFSVLGPSLPVQAVISDLILYRPITVKDFVDEKMLVIGQFYRGSSAYYKSKDAIKPIENGLHIYVHNTKFSNYKRIEANERFINIGFVFRESFFDNSFVQLEDDFFERAAVVLNSEPLSIPKITSICTQIRDCELSGPALRFFVLGKALETFSLIYDYVYRKDIKKTVYLSAEDKKTLYKVRKYIEDNYNKNLRIENLTKKFFINQQKLVTGFKETFNISINAYMRDLRLNKAVEMLIDTDIPVSDIIQKIGYYGNGFFQKTFKKTYGLTPTEMRKLYK